MFSADQGFIVSHDELSRLPIGSLNQPLEATNPSIERELQPSTPDSSQNSPIVPVYRPFQKPGFIWPVSPSDTTNSSDGEKKAVAPLPRLTITLLGQEYEPRRISDNNRRLIASIVRTFPRMMTQTDNAPPFLHAQTHTMRNEYSMELSETNPSPGTITPAMIPSVDSLATCHSVANMFIEESRRFEHLSQRLWRAIDSEFERITTQVSCSVSALVRVRPV